MASRLPLASYARESNGVEVYWFTCASAGAGVVPVTSGHGSMDLGAPGVHKASGLEILMDRWGIDWSQTATFGDSFNDLEMLKRARFSVAMANAAEELKQIARFTTDSNDADGVLNQLEQWFA